MKGIDEFCQKLVDSYLSSIGITEPFYFEGGEQVRPVPPVDVAMGGVLILGAYPTARFNKVDKHVVPVGNISCPFASDTASGKELEDHYLTPLGLNRADCWITNLVKMFLFKEEHLPAGGREKPLNLQRKQYGAIAASPENLRWLDVEFQLAAPEIVITLGAEVAGILHGVTAQKERNELLTGERSSFSLGDHTYPAIHLAHPGIVMRKDGAHPNPWPEAHNQRHLPAAREVLQGLGLLPL